MRKHVEAKWRKIECPECGELYKPLTDAYRCPTCGAENYPDLDDEDWDDRRPGRVEVA